MAEQSTPGKPADTCIEGATNDVAITGMTPAGQHRAVSRGEAESRRALGTEGRPPRPY